MKYQQIGSSNTIKKIIQHDQRVYSMDSKMIQHLLINKYVIHHIKKIKDKNYMIISIDAEKTFNKIQDPFMTTKNKTLTRWEWLEHNKVYT